MKKDRVTVTVHPQVKEYLQQSHVNASGLVDKLVSMHMRGEIELG
jgi:hypothetical protein